MSRADELLPVPPRGDPEVYPGMELTEEHHRRLLIDERHVPGPPGGPDVRVIVYRPRGLPGPLPGVLSFHGGAFVVLRADSFAAQDADWALGIPAVVVAVDYRLAPEHPYPAAPEDCYASLRWLAGDGSRELGVDPARLAVVGASAGGALAAAVCLMARDRGGPPVAFQALRIPVLDDRLDTPSMDQGVDAPGFDRARAEGMWLHYLGEDADRRATPAYAAPARAEDLSGLPPAFIQTNGLDPLRDEGIAYAARLMAAGVPVELYNAPGAYHGAPPLEPRATLEAARLLDATLVAALGASAGDSGDAATARAVRR